MDSRLLRCFSGGSGKAEDLTFTSGNRTFLPTQGSSFASPVCRVKVLLQKLLVAPRSPRQKLQRPHRFVKEESQVDFRRGALLSASFERSHI